MSEAIKKPVRTPESYSPKKPEIVRQIAEAINNQSPQYAYPESFILEDKSTQLPPEIKHYGPATAATANEFAFSLDYTGQGYGFVFDGPWCKDRSYTIANILSGHAMEPAPVFSKKGADYLWKTAGFPFCHTFYANPDNGDYMTMQEMKDAFKYALCVLKQPVVIPHSEFFCGSIVIGYKDSGDTLVTFRYNPYFMDMENNAKPIVEDVSDWYSSDTALFIAGKRENILSISNIYNEALRRIRDCMDENIRGTKQNYYSNWESFLRMSVDEMIAEVRRTGLVPGGEHGANDVYNRREESAENMWKFICRTNDTTWCNMAERRFYVMNFFQQLMEFYPNFTDNMQALADHFWHTNTIMADRYGHEVGDPVNIEMFKNLDVRARMADCVRQFKEADAKGFEMVEKLLICMGVPLY